MPGRIPRARIQASALMSSSARSPGHDGDGDRELAGRGADGQRRHERTGAGGLLGGAQHEHGNVLVLVDLLEDLLDLLAFADHFFGRHAFVARRC